VDEKAAVVSVTVDDKAVAVPETADDEKVDPKEDPECSITLGYKYGC
jgi:hypothetical protein